MIDLNTIPRIVINIKERTDRLTQFHIENDIFFNNQNTIIMEALVGTPSREYISQSHKKAIQLAKDNNWESILIMEDDIKFMPSSFNYAQECFNNLPKDWDILLGGIYTSNGLRTVNKYWKQTITFSGAHFYIVNKKAYDKILSMPNSRDIDIWLADKRGGNLNCYVVDQFFAIQHPGYSNNVGKVIDYTDLLKKFKLYKPR